MNTFNFLNLELISEHLKLTPISMEFSEDIRTHFTAEITKYMWPSAPKSQGEINSHILLKQKQMQTGEEIFLVITSKNSNEFLGCTSIHQANTMTPELGIWLKKPAQGHSFGCEAIKLLKSWAELNLNYNYLKYPVDRKNIPSCKLAEKLGGIIEAEYTKRSESGNLLDEVEYRFYKKQ